MLRRIGCNYVDNAAPEIGKFHLNNGHFAPFPLKALIHMVIHRLCPKPKVEPF
jgi:hypothetical protein